MDKQLNMFSKNEVTNYRLRKVTPKNEVLMKQCFEDVYKMGMVSNETIAIVRSKNYVKYTHSRQ